MLGQNWEGQAPTRCPKSGCQKILRYALITLGSLGIVCSGPRAAGQVSLLSSPGSGWSSGIISGSVVRDDNRPASQVAVDVQAPAQQIYRSVLTDQEGHFEIRGLPTGMYEVTVSEPGCQSDRTTTHVDGTMSNVVLHLRSVKPRESLEGRSRVSVHELRIPDKARDEYEKGMANNAKNQFAEGAEHLEKATQLYPDYYEAQAQLGVSKMGLGDFDKAIGNFQKAIDLSDGRYALAAFGIGYTFYLQGKLEAAEKMLRRGLEIDPESVNGYFCLGMTLFRLNKVDEAEKSGQEAIRRKPDFAPAYIVLANVYGKRRQFHEQLDALETYLKLSPDGASAQKVREARQITRAILAEGKDK
jgi:Tfp pilus assembly protein PilF